MKAVVRARRFGHMSEATARDLAVRCASADANAIGQLLHEKRPHIGVSLVCQASVGAQSVVSPGPEAMDSALGHPRGRRSSSQCRAGVPEADDATSGCS